MKTHESMKNWFTTRHVCFSLPVVPVDLLETKVSYGLSKDNTQINFFCDVTLGGKVVPDTVALEVEWLADDEVIQSETFGLLQQHKGVLKEEKWTIGQTVYRP